MRYMSLSALFFVFSAAIASLSGCGGSGSGSTTSNPFSSTTASSGAPQIFGNISTVAGKTGITMSTDRTTVDVNNGQVLVTAKLVNNNVAVSGVPVTFSIVAPASGPATIEPGLTTVTTDSNGIAVTRITTGNSLITTNVIVQATGTISGQTATATTTFQIVRGNGVIRFADLGIFEITVPAATPFMGFLQQVTFNVTDSNGNPRVGVPIRISIVSQTGDTFSPAAIDNSPVVTDSAGKGIFNISLAISTPSAGTSRSASVIYQATTNDVIPVTAYVGGMYQLTAE